MALRPGLMKRFCQFVGVFINLSISASVLESKTVKRRMLDSVYEKVELVHPKPPVRDVIVTPGYFFSCWFYSSF